MQKNQVKKFQLDQSEFWTQQLLKTGCVVLKDILTKQEVQKGQNQFWEWLEKLGSNIKRNDPSTWKNQNWPGCDQMGFFVSYGGCHTKTSWMVRTHKNVIQAFQKIWKVQDLITSMDTIISWRPWWNPQSNNRWNPYVQNIHLDQNPFFKTGLKCVQGMIPLKRVRKDEIGGLMVVPRSNNKQFQEQIIQRYPHTKIYGSDFIELKYNDPLMKFRQLVQCQAGDLILWDSRTVHGGKINDPSQQFKKQNLNDLVRLSVTVCMVPREWCSQQNLRIRQKYFKQKIGTTHWPHEPNKNSMGKMAKGINKQNITYEFPQLNEQIKKVL